MKILLLSFDEKYFINFINYFKKYCFANNIFLDYLTTDNKTSEYLFFHGHKVITIKQKQIMAFLSKLDKSRYDLILSMGYEKLNLLFDRDNYLKCPLYIFDGHMLGGIEDFGHHLPAVKKRELIKDIFLKNKIQIFSCFKEFKNLYKNLWIPFENITWIRYPLDIEYCHQNINKDIKIDLHNYILAPGNHRRDFETLIKAFKKINTDVKLLMIAKESEYPEAKKAADNKKIFFKESMYLDYFFAYLDKTLFAVLPLKKQKFICNGLTFLAHCFAFKKPLIVTENKTINNHVRKNYSALVVKPGDINDMAEKIKYLLENKEIRDKLGNNGFETVKNTMSFDSLMNIMFKNK